MQEVIATQAKKVAQEVIEASNLISGQILVIGCSTSVICGDKIGTNSNPEVATEVFNEIYKVTSDRGIYIAAQCCEHLNRAIIIEKDALSPMELSEIVNVMPQPKAGGSFATAAYKAFKNPVAVEEIKADAGMDIGGTLIGMHLKKVAVPLKLENNQIGEARVLAARTRPKFIGGDRAFYNEDLK